MTRILIINPSALTEIVHGLQVATSLRAQWPEDRGPLEIHWVVRDIFAPLVSSCTAIDKTFVFKRFGSTMDFFRLMREVRQTQYDYLLDLQGLLRTGLMTWQARAKKKIGRSNAREGAGTFYDIKVPLPPAGRRSHKLDIMLQFCPALGLKPELVGKLQFKELEKLKLSFIEGRRGVRPVLIFPDARRAEKKWSGYKQLTKLILDGDRSSRVIWAGDVYVPDKSSFPADRFLNITGSTSLFTLPVLIQRAAWVIANDSGPLHLAAALSVPTLGIFGPSDPRIWGPYPSSAPTNHSLHAPVGNLQILQAKEVYARFLQHSSSPKN